MVLNEVYTTSEKVLKDSSADKKESKKIVLSNDAFVIAELLECLINTTRNK